MVSDALIPHPHKFPLHKENRTLLRWAGHSHVCRKSTSPEKCIPEHVRDMKRLGLDYFGFGHPWEPWDLELAREWQLNPDRKRVYREEEVWKNMDSSGWLRPERFSYWKRRFNSKDFLFGVDLETPKIRFGHLWWLGWEPIDAPWHDYDSDWTAWEVSRTSARPPFRLRMPAEVIRQQVSHGALPVYAHPTSWWMENDHHITNIAATLVPDILTSQAAGCLVVMGYEADHAHYQELWYGLLNEGFYLTGVSETDACLDLPQPFERAVFHNVTPVRQFNLTSMKSALKLGHNIMTTESLLQITCGEAEAGDLVDEIGGRVTINLTSLDPDDSYRFSLVFNGKTIREETLTGLTEWNQSVDHHGSGWVLAKVVNLSRPYSSALTNPIFFKSPPVRVTGHELPKKLIKWWDAPEAMELLYYLSEGHWRKDFPGRNPGEIPWEAFRWADWKSLLERNAELT